MNKSISGLTDVIEASKQAGVRAHALDITNHLVGRYQWETRVVFKADDGALLSTATVRRSSKYLAPEIEKELLQQAREHAPKLDDGNIWVYREPILEASFWPFTTIEKQS